jgi:hypothetical protein
MPAWHCQVRTPVVPCISMGSPICTIVAC